MYDISNNSVVALQYDEPDRVKYTPSENTFILPTRPASVAGGAGVVIDDTFYATSGKHSDNGKSESGSVAN